MSNVVRLHSQTEVDRLWNEYAALARELVPGSPKLADRRHVEATARAQVRFQRAFLAMENGR